MPRSADHDESWCICGHGIFSHSLSGLCFGYSTSTLFCPCYEFIPQSLVELDSYEDYLESERENEMRLSSDLEGASTVSTIPIGPYKAHTIEVRDTDPSDVQKGLTSRAGAPMVQLDWEVDEGDYSGKRVKYDTIMLGGKSAEGKPIGLGNLCNFLHRTGTPWYCRDCETESQERGHRFYIGEGSEDDKTRGLKRGFFYCPECKNPVPRIGYDTSNFLGARCTIGVGVKTNEGREFNIIKGYSDV